MIAGSSPNKKINEVLAFVEEQPAITTSFTGVVNRNDGGLYQLTKLLPEHMRFNYLSRLQM